MQTGGLLRRESVLDVRWRCFLCNRLASIIRFDSIYIHRTASQEHRADERGGSALDVYGGRMHVQNGIQWPTMVLGTCRDAAGRFR